MHDPIHRMQRMNNVRIRIERMHKAIKESIRIVTSNEARGINVLNKREM